MAFTRTIRAFGALSHRDPLVDAYRILVAIELALKDAGCVSPQGHDVPTMLAHAAVIAAPSQANYVSAQLTSFSAQLRNDLTAIICQGKNGHPCSVPPHSYPHIRYVRQQGDWGGIQETPANLILGLEATCQHIMRYLSIHGKSIGVLL